jgi:hypothetical protein
MKSRTAHKRTAPATKPGKTAAGQSIQERAYQLYLSRGQEPGHELEDWLQAEREARQWREKQKTG